MAITVTRENLYYIGWAKQSGLGSPTAPTQFWRWQDGTEANPEMKMNEEMEGDTGPHINLVYKGSQYWKITVKERIRPITAGCALQAIMGTGSDAYTAPVTTSTLSAGVAAGATTFSVAASLGSAGTLYMGFTPGYSSTTYEVQNVNLASRSGVGPYTYTLAASATFQNAHTNGDTVATAATHVFTRQLTTYDYYTIEVAFSQAGFGKALRIQDCVCVEVKITGQAGKALDLEHTWYGTFATEEAALLTPSFEGTNIVGSPGSPLVYYQGAGWTLDGATTGNALTVTQFNFDLKNSTAAEDGLNELLNPAFFLPSNFTCKGSVEVQFQNYNQYLNTYYGSSSAGAGSVDSYLTGFGAFQVQFNGDGPTVGANAPDFLKLVLPNLAYTGAPLKPKLDGKVLKQQLAVTAVKSPAQPQPVTVTLSNGQASQY